MSLCRSWVWASLGLPFPCISVAKVRRIDWNVKFGTPRLAASGFRCRRKSLWASLGVPFRKRKMYSLSSDGRTTSFQWQAQSGVKLEDRLGRPDRRCLPFSRHQPRSSPFFTRRTALSTLNVYPLKSGHFRANCSPGRNAAMTNNRRMRLRGLARIDM